MKKISGFTMIELMITITILGTLTMLTAQSIQQAVKAKGKLQNQIDDSSRIRDAARLLERDINLAYHYRDIELELEQLIKKTNQKSNQSAARATGNQFAPPITNETPQSLRHTNRYFSPTSPPGGSARRAF